MGLAPALWCYPPAIMGLRSHYVSRFVTSPWEIEPRKLVYVDLQAGVVRTKSSKSLFAVEDGLDAEMERLFSDYIEAPIGKIRSRWLDGGGRSSIDDWAEYRALYLLLMLQAPRFAEVLGRFPAGTNGLDILREPTHLDQLVARAMDQNQLATFVVPKDAGFFMPETGVFPFFIQDRGCATGWTLATGMALHPRIALVMVSKSVTPDVLEWYSKHTGHVVALSIGLGFDIRHVVVPHGVLLGEGEEGTVRYVRESIERNRDFIRAVFEIRKLASEMWQNFGFSLRNREVGDPAEAMWNEDTLKLRPSKEPRPSTREISR